MIDAPLAAGERDFCLQFQGRSERRIGKNQQHQGSKDWTAHGVTPNLQFAGLQDSRGESSILISG